MLVSRQAKSLFIALWWQSLTRRYIPDDMEGDTTNFYLYKKLSPFNVEISTIARGVSIGDELEYADEITLGRSILNRTPYTV